MQEQKEPFVHKSEEERRTLIRKYMDQGETRCFFCGKLLFKGTLGQGSDISPKCPRCKKDNSIRVL